MLLRLHDTRFHAFAAALDVPPEPKKQTPLHVSLRIGTQQPRQSYDFLVLVYTAAVWRETSSPPSAPAAAATAMQAIAQSRTGLSVMRKTMPSPIARRVSHEITNAGLRSRPKAAASVRVCRTTRLRRMPLMAPMTATSNHANSPTASHGTQPQELTIMYRPEARIATTDAGPKMRANPATPSHTSTCALVVARRRWKMPIPSAVNAVKSISAPTIC